MATSQDHSLQGQQPVEIPPDYVEKVMYPPQFIPAFQNGVHPSAAYQNGVYPNGIFPTGHLAPGTYYSATEDVWREEEEVSRNRRLRTIGISLMVCGMLSILFGLGVVLLSTWYIRFIIVVGAPWWSGLMSTVGGILALGVQQRGGNTMVISSLLLNLINVVSLTPAIVLYAMSIDFFFCFWYYCSSAEQEFMISIVIIFLFFNGLAPPPMIQDPLYATIDQQGHPPAYSVANTVSYNVPM